MILLLPGCDVGKDEAISCHTAIYSRKRKFQELAVELTFTEQSFSGASTVGWTKYRSPVEEITPKDAFVLI